MRVLRLHADLEELDGAGEEGVDAAGDAPRRRGLRDGEVGAVRGDEALGEREGREEQRVLRSDAQQRGEHAWGFGGRFCVGGGSYRV